jgi:hypothetical protein
MRLGDECGWNKTPFIIKQEHVGNDLGLSVGTVRRETKKLQTLGLLRAWHKGTANMYKLRIKAISALILATEQTCSASTEVSPVDNRKPIPLSSANFAKYPEAERHGISDNDWWTVAYFGYQSSFEVADQSTADFKENYLPGFTFEDYQHFRKKLERRSTAKSDRSWVTFTDEDLANITEEDDDGWSPLPK